MQDKWAADVETLSDKQEVLDGRIGLGWSGADTPLTPWVSLVPTLPLVLS